MEIINKQAYHDYQVLETYQAGLVLLGAEVKSVKAGSMNLKGSFITIKSAPQPELYLLNAHISPYKPAGTRMIIDPARTRKLLLRRTEIDSLIGKTDQKGLTLIPLKVYTTRNLIKLEFGLAKGKKLFEKKEQKKKKDIEKEIRTAMKYRG